MDINKCMEVLHDIGKKEALNKGCLDRAIIIYCILKQENKNSNPEIKNLNGDHVTILNNLVYDSRKYNKPIPKKLYEDNERRKNPSLEWIDSKDYIDKNHAIKNIFKYLKEIGNEEFQNKIIPIVNSQYDFEGKKWIDDKN